MCVCFVGCDDMEDERTCVQREKEREREKQRDRDEGNRDVRSSVTPMNVDTHICGGLNVQYCS